MLSALSSSQLAAYIDEWKSPDFHAPIIMGGIAIPTIVAIMVLAAGRRRVEVFHLVVWVVFLLATLRTRFMPSWDSLWAVSRRRTSRFDADDEGKHGIAATRAAFRTPGSVGWQLSCCGFSPD